MCLIRMVSYKNNVQYICTSTCMFLTKCLYIYCITRTKYIFQKSSQKQLKTHFYGFVAGFFLTIMCLSFLTFLLEDITLEKTALQPSNKRIAPFSRPMHVPVSAHVKTVGSALKYLKSPNTQPQWVKYLEKNLEKINQNHAKRKEARGEKARVHVIKHKQFQKRNLTSQSSRSKIVQHLVKYERTAPLSNSTEGDRIVIVSNMRSGSSFIGRILSEDEQTFYAYEPLWFLDPDRLEKNLVCASYKLQSLSDLLFKCEMDKLRQCAVGKNEEHGKKMFPTLRKTSKCKYSRHRVAKIIRYFDVESLADEIVAKGGILLYLVRDPRGIMTSRRTAYKTMERERMLRLNEETEDLCSNFERNLRFLENYFRNSNSTHSGKIVVLRYEDFAYSPAEMTEKLYAFLGRSADRNVWKYLLYSTKARTSEADDIWSTYRDSERTAEAWRDTIELQRLTFVQEKCSRTLQQLGYVLVNNASMLRDRSTSLVSSMKVAVPVLRRSDW